jgi:hypothetical protein
MPGSSPNWPMGYIPSPSEWNTAFAGKADYSQLQDVATTANSALSTANEALALASNPQPYIIGGYIPSTYASNQILVQHLFEIPVTFPINFAGSGCFIPAGFVATANSTLPILKNGAFIGTLNITAGSQISTFTVAAAQSFAAGDVLSLAAAGLPDVTLANMSPTFLGQR